MMILGITGTLGAGKGTIVNYLVNSKGFKHYSARKFLVEEIEKRGLPVNRDTMTKVANNLRANHSPSYIIEQLHKEAKKVGKNAIIESIRTPSEVAFLKNQGEFYLIAIDADPQIRYQRIILRATETDHISYNTFLSNEKREFTTNDRNKQNLSQCIQLADIVLQNNGEVDELYQKLEMELAEIM
ncbi:MAG: AAA family ATPase [Bacteroidetes bacterium]|nr:AAA family ATPase [Bacteroidota bacterium]MBL6943468.1 AAA family ATPase [Bacteroidales bacterium]